MRQRSSNHMGIVLRRVETPAGDLICTLFGPNGKYKGIARGGVRGPLTSTLNLFHHVQVQLYQTPQTDLPTIQQAVLEGALPRLAELERYTWAHMMAELTGALFQEGEPLESAVFETVAASLRGIAHQDDPEWVALVMCFKLLASAGLRPQLTHCARCRQTYPTVPDGLGGLHCTNCVNSMSRNMPQIPQHTSHTLHTSHTSRNAYNEQKALELPKESLEFLYYVYKRNVRTHMQNPVPPHFRRSIWLVLERHLNAQVGRLNSFRALI